MVAIKGRRPALSSRRQVSFINGDISIIKAVSPRPPNLLLEGKEPSKVPSPPYPSPFPLQSLPKANPSSPPKAPQFSSFADLFKNLSDPSSAKGILPLPPPQHTRLSDQGWTTVVNKKRAARRPFPAKDIPPAKIKRCFLCGDPNHMARSCKLGSFKCFVCKKLGHTSRACPSRSHPSPSSPPVLLPAKIPIISTSSSIKDRILLLSSFGYLSLSVGSPSSSEIKEMLEYRFNIKDWNLKILKVQDDKFLIEFPSSELRDQAISMGFSDMGSFGGTFGAWRETQGLEAYPRAELCWVKLSGLPLHLWDADFISEIFKDVGGVHACSRNIMFMEEIEQCKVLLRVKSRRDVPKCIPFRYISPVNGWLLEGRVLVEFYGKPFPEEAINSNRGVDFLMNEGDSSSHFSWKGLNELDLVGNSEVQRPLPTDLNPPLVISSPMEQSLGAVDKGKKVMESDSVPAGVKASINATQHLNSSPPNQSPLVNVTVDGKDLLFSRASWERFLLYAKQGSQGPSSPASHISPSLFSASATKLSTDAISSSAQPPGFERFRPLRLRRRRRAPLSLGHIPHRRFMEGSSRRAIPLSAKGQSSSPSTPCMPLNALSVDSLSSIAANCGVANPLSVEMIKSIKEREAERANSLC